MTKLLEEVFNELKKLPEQEQNNIAQWILEEIKSEKKWQELFDKSQKLLEEMAKEALKEYNQGKKESKTSQLAVQESSCQNAHFFY